MKDADNPFAIRALITMQSLASPHMRGAVRTNLEIRPVDSLTGEGHKAYEERIVEGIEREMVGWIELPASRLTLTKVRSKPDGLFIDESAESLLIVEVKMKAPDFGDGAGQILQYVGQAHHHPEFSGLATRSVLVSSTIPKTDQFGHFLALLESDKPIGIAVEGSSIAPRTWRRA